MGSSRRPVMEMKNLLLLFLAVVVGCHAATQEQLGGDKEMVRLIKFVRDHLALDVQANRNLTEESNNQTVDIAEAIIQHVNDVNDAATTGFEETLNKMTTAMEKNLRSIVDQTQKNHKKLEEQSKDNEEMIRREASEKLNDLLDKTKGRLAQHEQMLDTNVAVCAYKHNNDVAGKVQYDLKQMEIVSLPGGEMTQTSFLTSSKESLLFPKVQPAVTRSRSRPSLTPLITPMATSTRHLLSLQRHRLQVILCSGE